MLFISSSCKSVACKLSKTNKKLVKMNNNNDNFKKKIDVNLTELLVLSCATFENPVPMKIAIHQHLRHQVLENVFQAHHLVPLFY